MRFLRAPGTNLTFNKCTCICIWDHIIALKLFSQTNNPVHTLQKNMTPILQLFKTNSSFQNHSYLQYTCSTSFFFSTNQSLSPITDGTQLAIFFFTLLQDLLNSYTITQNQTTPFSFTYPYRSKSDQIKINKYLFLQVSNKNRFKLPHLQTDLATKVITNHS